jgi:putative FmdB family regulatory protein
MPLYTYTCQCGSRDTVFAKIVSRDDPRECPQCNRYMTRILEAPYVRPEIQPYISPASGRVINSRDQRRDDLRRSGCIEWEPGIREEAEKNRVAGIEANFRTVDASIDKTVAEMHAANLI